MSDGSFARDREDSKRERLLRIKQKHEQEGQLSTSKKYRYIFVAVITGAYCIAELGVAVAIDSLALLSDGFHNLGDLIALAIAWWCEQNKTRKAEKQYTYGFQRAEILGGLANGWALVALAFLLGLETIPRFYEHPDLSGNGWLFIAIAAAGVLINTVGTLAFARDGHGHSHGPKASEEEHHHLRKASSDDEYGALHGHGSLNSDHHDDHEEPHGHSHGSHDLNMRAVFLHYLGDSLSSICVLIEGIFLHVFDDSGDWVNYLDPTFTIVIISIILITTWPLLKECSKLVLQTTPNNIDIDVVKDRLLKVSGVSAIHDVHVWTLSNDVHVAALHFQCLITADCRKILSEMREVLHQFGIHSSTLQPDFIDKAGENPSPHCEENCVQNCTKKWCCQSDSISSFNLESP